MKKIYQFLCSMRFGMILLLLIAALCIAATALGMDSIYTSWYFIALFAMLGLNLLFCSVLRVFRLGKQKQALVQKAIHSEAALCVPDEAKWLKDHHFKPDGEVYSRNSFGFLGAFFTHFAMLLLMAAAACIFLLAETQDAVIFPEDPLSLPDGTALLLESFSLKAESGETQYRSSLSALLPSGEEVHGVAEVNHPVKFGRYKIYQQNYGYAAVIGVKTDDAPVEEPIWLDEPAFLSLDGENGIYFTQIFGNVVEHGGEVMVSRSGEMVNPAYEVRVIDGGKDETSIIYPGTAVHAGGVTYSFREPQAYPGLRIKTQPDWTLWLLYFSFALMLLGLYLCFFRIPEAAHVKKDGLTIVGRKDISDQIEHYKEEMESDT